MIDQLIHHSDGDSRTIGFFPYKKAFKMLRAMSAVHGAENLSIILVPESTPYIDR